MGGREHPVACVPRRDEAWRGMGTEGQDWHGGRGGRCHQNAAEADWRPEKRWVSLREAPSAHWGPPPCHRPAALTWPHLPRAPRLSSATLGDTANRHTQHSPPSAGLTAAQGAAVNTRDHTRALPSGPASRAGGASPGVSPGQRHPAPAASAGAAPPPAADRGPPDDHAVQEVGEPAVAGDVGEVREAPLRGQERASDCDGRQVCRKQRAPAPRPGCGRALTTSAPGSREQVAWAAPATLRHPRAPLPCDGGGCPGTATPDPPPATTRSPQLPPPHGSEPPAEFRGPRRGASRVTGLTSSLKPMCIPQSSMTFLPAMETRMQLRPTSWPAPAGATGQVLPNPSLPSGPPHPRRALGGAGHDPRLLWGHVRRGSRHLRTLTGERDARGGDKVPSPPGQFRRECPPHCASRLRPSLYHLGPVHGRSPSPLKVAATPL